MWRPFVSSLAGLITETQQKRGFSPPARILSISMDERWWFGLRRRAFEAVSTFRRNGATTFTHTRTVERKGQNRNRVLIFNQTRKWLARPFEPNGRAVAGVTEEDRLSVVPFLSLVPDPNSLSAKLITWRLRSGCGGKKTARSRMDMIERWD